MIAFPHRPVPNLQYWFADIAYIQRADWDALPPEVSGVGTISVDQIFAV